LLLYSFYKIREQSPTPAEKKGRLSGIKIIKNVMKLKEIN
jgi:hypothetical protein